MFALLVKADIYGTDVPITVFGEPKVKTACGGVLSLLTYIIIAFFSFLFGSDFFFKTTPRVIDSEEVPLKTSHLVLNLDKIAFMARIYIDGTRKVIDYDNSPLNFINGYVYYKLENGTLITKARVFSNAIKCSGTGAINIEGFKNLNLDEWLCPNWDEIKKKMRTQLNDPDFEIKLGGTLDEEELYFLNFSLENNYIDPSTGNAIVKKSIKETQNFIVQNKLMLNFFYPNAMYEAKSYEKPLKITHLAILQDINANTWFRNDLTFKTLISEDDKGAMFKSLSFEEAFVPAEIKSGGQPVRNEPNEIIRFNFFLIFLGKEQKIKSRSYMKIQELSAIVGGAIKFVFVAFGQIGKTVAKFKFLLKVTDIFYKEKTVHTSVVQLSPNVNSFVEVDKSKQEPIEIGFFTYYFSCLFRQNEEIRNKFQHFKMAEREIEKQLDVIKLIEHFSKFDQLCDLVLTEEQKNQLIAVGIEATK